MTPPIPRKDKDACPLTCCMASAGRTSPWEATAPGNPLPPQSLPSSASCPRLLPLPRSHSKPGVLTAPGLPPYRSQGLLLSALILIELLPVCHRHSATWFSTQVPCPLPCTLLWSHACSGLKPEFKSQGPGSLDQVLSHYFIEPHSVKRLVCTELLPFRFCTP